VSDVENDILRDMGIDLNETSETTEQETVTEQPEQQTAEQPEPVDSQQSTDDITGEQQQPAPQPEAPQVDTASGEEKLKSDAKGNLINERGHVIATAGRERRYFERAQKASNTVNQQSQYIRDLETRTRELESVQNSNTALNGLPQQLGLNGTEAELGLKLIKSYKTDPIGTIKYILTEAAASGHNINDLIGRDGGIDMNAIGRMIDQRLQPVTEQYSQQQAMEQAKQEAQRQINQFYAKYPDAPTHEDVIGKMLQSDPTLSLEGAYAQLLRVAQVHGLDFSQPLRPQLEAKQNAPLSSARKPSAPPSGRAPTATVPATNTMPVDANTSYENVIRQSMTAAGLSFEQ
jgi:hypothetical protein